MKIRFFPLKSIECFVGGDTANNGVIITVDFSNSEAIKRFLVDGQRGFVSDN